MEISQVEVASILTRSSGFLRTVSSHSLQPYRGCPLGSSLCGQACYVQHSPWVTRGRPWGSFLEVRGNAAESYLAQVSRERAWARRRGEFVIFMASATEPFPVAERRFGVTQRVLRAMAQEPPDLLIVQSHTAEVTRYQELLRALPRVRIHLSVETDRERLPGLPPPAVPVRQRLEAAGQLKAAGFTVVITVSPLLPIEHPERFFARVAEVADAVVLDHFIGGDGTPDGRRTARTAVPAAMRALEPGSERLDYRDRMAVVARRFLPVGLSVDGFAGRYLQEDEGSGGEHGRPCGTSSDA